MYFRIISQEEQYLFSRNTFQICIWRGNQIKNTRRMLRDWYRGNQSKSGVRWTDKEVVIPIYNGILLNHKKECIWVRSNEVDEPRAYHTEQSEAEDKYCILAHIYQRRQWHPTPVLLPGKSHGRRSLVGCSPWGR